MSSTRHLLDAAMAAHRKGDAAAAERGYRAVLAAAPENTDALHLLGVIVSRSDPDEGIRLIERALSLGLASFEAHYNLGNIHARRPRMADAERHFRIASGLAPSHAEAANGLGGALLHLGRYAESEACLRRALALQPALPTALLNMGTLMDAVGRFTEAIAYYDRVLALSPGHEEALRHKALAHLVRGDFPAGWRGYASREGRIPTFFGRFPYPHWNGEPLAGRKILVWTEQGLGDEILIAGMVPDLLQAGARVVLLCSPRLVRLFRRAFPAADVIPTGEKPQDPGIMAGLDVQASMSDLGRHLRPSFAAFPHRAFLAPDTEAAAGLRKKYKAAAPGTLLVGLSWHSTNPLMETAKSIPLQDWTPLLRTPGVTFVNLQYGPDRPALDVLARDAGFSAITDPAVDPGDDMDAAAAQIAAMDLVISVSNTAVHIAGALGKPVWAFIPSGHGRLWYWFLERTDSPWYPLLRLFRQNPKTGWESPMAEAAAALAHVARRAGRDGRAPAA